MGGPPLGLRLVFAWGGGFICDGDPRVAPRTLRYFLPRLLCRCRDGDQLGLVRDLAPALVGGHSLRTLRTLAASLNIIPPYITLGLSFNCTLDTP